MKSFPVLSKLYIWVLPGVLFQCMISCQKLLDVGEPSTLVTSTQIYSNDSLATKALTGIYSQMMNGFDLMNGYMSQLAGLYTDEMDRTSLLNLDQPFLTNTLFADNTRLRQIWSSAYAYIYSANAVAEGLAKDAAVSARVRTQLMGEALFLRALTYFYLANLFGDAPLVLSTDYASSAMLPRTTVAVIYDQVVQDLNEAKKMLPTAYATTAIYSTERVRANKWAAAALMARAYLYRGLWADAEAEAGEVIQSGDYRLEDLQAVFLASSQEAILQFMPVSPTYNTAEAGMYVPLASTVKPVFVLTDSLLKSFELADMRISWVRQATVNGKDYYSPYKLKVNQGPPYREYNMVLRLAEQYLIRAEARAQQNKLSEAIADLNTIRARAGLSSLSRSMTKTRVLEAIEQERRIELFAEWGHRLLDLKRWPSRSYPLDPDKKRMDDIMGSLRPATWNATDKLWPIPASQLQLNKNLTQNPGY